MDLFFLCFQPTNRTTIDSQGLLQKALASFSQGKNAVVWQEGSYTFATVPTSNFFVKFQLPGTKNTQFFLGRDFRSFQKEVEGGTDPQFASYDFPYIHFKLAGDDSGFSVSNDDLGLYSYFYTEVNGTIFVSNYFPAMSALYGSQLAIDETLYSTLLCNGVVSPGETFFKEISMSHPLEDISISRDGIQKIRKKPLKFAAGRVTPEEIYHQFTASVNKILSTSNIRWINLTGGADTRLILSTLTPCQRDSIQFVFDEVNSNPKHIPFDRVVVKMLAEKFKLNIRYRFPSHRVDLKLGPYDTVQEFSVFNQLMTGMYGGETLGGNAFFCLPEPHGAATSETEKFEKKRQTFRDYSGSQSDFLYRISVLFNSFSSLIYTDKNWIHPYTLFQKKISPFINVSLLKLLISMKPEDLKCFRLYAEIYRKCAPEMLSVPFFSAMTSFNYPKIQAVQSSMDSDLFIENPASQETSEVRIQFPRETEFASDEIMLERDTHLKKSLSF